MDAASATLTREHRQPRDAVPPSGRSRWLRLAALLTLGGLLVAVELWLRNQRDLTGQVIGQMVAFGLFLPAAWLAWRGLGLRWVGVVAIVLVAVGLRGAVFVPYPPVSSDLYRYAWDARVLDSGTNPYRYTTFDPALAELWDEEIWARINLPSWGTPYPPAAEASFYAARKIFGGGARATTKLFFVAEAGVLALLLFVLVRAGRPPERLLLYAWHPLTVSEVAANGHVDALAALAVAGLLAAWTARRMTLAGVVLAFGTLVKFSPGLLIVALARRGRVRLVAPAVAIVAVAYAVASIGGVNPLGSAPRLVRSFEIGSVESVLSPHIGQPWARALLIPVVAVTLILVALRQHESVDEVARSTLLVVGTLLLSMMVLQPWYFLALIPCLTLVSAPGWLWLSGALPLIYLNGETESLPGWVLPVMYLPFGAWTLWRVIQWTGVVTARRVLDPAT
jgi:alpha-1,6-mannosyltransferase